MARNYYELKTSYNYSELSSAAKERVAEWLNVEGYAWAGDALDDAQRASRSILAAR
jgi:hypothetical protein